jgi:hypothetical protein
MKQGLVAETSAQSINGRLMKVMAKEAGLSARYNNGQFSAGPY